MEPDGVDRLAAAPTLTVHQYFGELPPGSYAVRVGYRGDRERWAMSPGCSTAVLVPGGSSIRVQPTPPAWARFYYVFMSEQGGYLWLQAVVPVELPFYTQTRLLSRVTVLPDDDGDPFAAKGTDV